MATTTTETPSPPTTTTTTGVLVQLALIDAHFRKALMRFFPMEGEGSRPFCSLSDAFCWRTRVSCIHFLCSTSLVCQEQLSFPLACMGLTRLRVPKALSMRVSLSLTSVAGPRKMPMPPLLLFYKCLMLPLVAILGLVHVLLQYAPDVGRACDAEEEGWLELLAEDYQHFDITSEVQCGSLTVFCLCQASQTRSFWCMFCANQSSTYSSRPRNEHCRCQLRCDGLAVTQPPTTQLGRGRPSQENGFPTSPTACTVSSSSPKQHWNSSARSWLCLERMKSTLSL